MTSSTTTARRSQIGQVAIIALVFACVVSESDAKYVSMERLEELMSDLFFSNYTNSQKDVLWKTKYSNHSLIACGFIIDITRNHIILMYAHDKRQRVIAVGHFAASLSDGDFVAHERSSSCCIQGTLREIPKYLPRSDWEDMIPPGEEPAHDWGKPEEVSDLPRRPGLTRPPLPKGEQQLDLVFKLEGSSLQD